MLLCHHHHAAISLVLRPSPILNSNPSSPSLLPLRFPFCSSSTSFTLSVAATHAFDASHEASGSTSGEQEAFRLQNANASAFLLLQSQPYGKDGNSVELLRGEDEERLLRKRIADEYSLAPRRTPRFPGSIDFPKPEPPMPPGDLRSLLDGDDDVLRRALAVRRGVAAEVLKEALRAGKLSINYSNNLVSWSQGFVDRVVIEAAAMKAIPEFAHLSFNARAKRYVQSSAVVPLVKWLKHVHLTYPQIGKILCTCVGDHQRVRRTAEWLKSIHVKGESLGAVFVKANAILGRDLESLEEIISYLEENEVKSEWIGFIIGRCPQILLLTMESLEARVKFYLDMGMSKKDFGTMVFDYPRALGFYSMEDMASKVGYLKEFGLSTEDVGRLLAFKPQLMGCSIEERWKPLVKYLYYLGVKRDGMKRMLVIKPMIFCVDLETTIAPKVRFLQDIGVRNEAVGDVLVKFPSLLTYSLYKKIRPVVIFLMTKAGVSQKDIGKVIALDPQLIGCSITKKLEVNVKYFLSLGIRLQSLGEMVADFPMLLRYNIDILRPKYKYLRRIMVRPLQDLIEFPRFFSYSLDSRIIPRHKIMVENRINFKLRYMLAGSDEDFNQRVQVAVEKRKRFESGYGDSELQHSDSCHLSPLPLEPTREETALVVPQPP